MRSTPGPPSACRTSSTGSAMCPVPARSGSPLGRTNTVGMLVPSLGWPWMSDDRAGRRRHAGGGRSTACCSTPAPAGRIRSTNSPSSVAANSCDGLIVVAPEDGLGHITDLYERGLPVVVIDDRGEPAAAAHRGLHQPGRRRERRPAPARAWAAPSPLCSPGSVISAACRSGSPGSWRSTVEAGHELSADQVIEGDFTADCGRAAVGEVGQHGPPFDAVFAMNDLSAAGVIGGHSGARPPDPGRCRRHRIRRCCRCRAHRPAADHDPPADAGDGRRRPREMLLAALRRCAVAVRADGAGDLPGDPRVDGPSVTRLASCRLPSWGAVRGTTFGKPRTPIVGTTIGCYRRVTRVS